MVTLANNYCRHPTAVKPTNLQMLIHAYIESITQSVSALRWYGGRYGIIVNTAKISRCRTLKLLQHAMTGHFCSQGTGNDSGFSVEANFLSLKDRASENRKKNEFTW